MQCTEEDIEQIDGTVATNLDDLDKAGAKVNAIHKVGEGKTEMTEGERLFAKLSARKLAQLQ